MRRSVKPGSIKSITKESVVKVVPDISEVQRRKRIFTKYKLSILLKNELEIEASEKGTLSNKINNEVLLDRYKIYEGKDNNRMFLHKRVQDYYIVLKFNEIKLKIDKLKIAQMKNEHLRMVRAQVNIKDKMSQAIGIESNPDFQSIRELEYEKELGEGDLSIEKENFEIHIINKNSECVQYYCTISFNEITIAFVKFINNYEEDIGLINSLNYNGPEFDSLNPLLQKNFVDFLYSLEIYPDIAKYIMYLGLNKNKRNYIKFLSTFKNLMI